MNRLSLGSCKSRSLTYAHIRFTVCGRDSLVSPTRADRESLSSQSHLQARISTQCPTTGHLGFSLLVSGGGTYLRIRSLLKAVFGAARFFLGPSSSPLSTVAALLFFFLTTFFALGLVLDPGAEARLALADPVRALNSDCSCLAYASSSCSPSPSESVISAFVGFDSRLTFGFESGRGSDEGGGADWDWDPDGVWVESKGFSSDDSDALSPSSASAVSSSYIPLIYLGQYTSHIILSPLPSG